MIPYDADAERAVIGAMLLSVDPRGMALDLLEPADFYVPDHRQLFGQIAELHHAGKPIDYVSLQRTPDELRSFQDDAPISLAVRSNAARVRDRAAARRALVLADELRERAEAVDLEAIETLIGRAPEILATPGMNVDPPIEASLLAEEDHTPDWLVNDLLARYEIALFVGEPGHGKSTLLRQIGTCLASGMHPFTRVPIIPLRVMLLDCQDSRGSAGRAIRKLLHLSGDRYRGTMYVELRPQGVDLTTRRDQRWLEAKVASVRADVVIAGPLYNMVRGANGRPKHAEETAELAGSFLSELVVRRNCALLIEAHAPHGEELRVRGSKYWEDWAAFGFGLQSGRGDERRFEVKRFRGDREAGREWPREFVQGAVGHWPWEALYEKESA